MVWHGMAWFGIYSLNKRDYYLYRQRHALSLDLYPRHSPFRTWHTGAIVGQFREGILIQCADEFDRIPHFIDACNARLAQLDDNITKAGKGYVMAWNGMVFEWQSAEFRQNGSSTRINHLQVIKYNILYHTSSSVFVVSMPWLRRRPWSSLSATRGSWLTRCSKTWLARKMYVVLCCVVLRCVVFNETKPFALKLDICSSCVQRLCRYNYFYFSINNT